MKTRVLVIGVILAVVSGSVIAQEGRLLREGRLQALQLDWQSRIPVLRAINAHEPTSVTTPESMEQQLLLRQLREPQGQDKGAGHLRLLQNSTFRVVPGGNGPGSLESVLNGISIKEVLPTMAVTATKAELAKADVACTTTLVETLEETQRGVEATPLEPPMDTSGTDPDERLYRLLSGTGMPSGESAKSLPKLRQLEAAWRAVLSACFIPPSQLATFQTVAARVGVFIVPNRPPFCSGTLMADGIVLTARHCFFRKGEATPQKDLVTSLVFAPADGSLPLKLDAKQFDTAEAFDDTLQDQLLVKVAVTGKPQPLFEQAASLATLTETKGELLGVTQMFMFGANPLARVLDAASYPHSIVGSARPGCFAIFKNDQCFTHMCGVMPGASGASMFTLRQNRILWAGQHTAAEGKELNLYCAGSTSAANFALRANRPEISALLKQ